MWNILYLVGNGNHTRYLCVAIDRAKPRGPSLSGPRTAPPLENLALQFSINLSISYQLGYVEMYGLATAEAVTK